MRCSLAPRLDSILSVHPFLERLSGSSKTDIPKEMLQAVMRREKVHTSLLNEFGSSSGLAMRVYYESVSESWTFDDFVAAIALSPSSDVLCAQFDKQSMVDKAVIAFSLLGQPIRAFRLVRHHIVHDFIVVLPPIRVVFRVHGMQRKQKEKKRDHPTGSGCMHDGFDRGSFDHECACSVAIGTSTRDVVHASRNPMCLVLVRGHMAYPELYTKKCMVSEIRLFYHFLA